MIIYQLFLIFVVVAAGIHGVEECNFTAQLDEHYLEGAYLDPNGAFFIRGEQVAKIRKNDPSDPDDQKIRVVDAIRTDVDKFALLGYREKNDAKRLKKIVLIGYGGNTELDLINVERFEQHDVAYYDKDKNAIFVDEGYKVTLPDGKIKSERGNKDCFKDNMRCVYDPYTQELKMQNAVTHNTLQFFSASSCRLEIKEYKQKAFLSDNHTEYTFCLGPIDDYHKIFLFPNFTQYDRNCTEDTVVLSKTPPTTKTPYRPDDIRHASYNAKVKEDVGTEDCDTTFWWVGAGIALAVSVLLLFAGLAMIVIERRGKAKKQAYMRLQRMLRKDEPSASVYTTMTQTNLDTQDDGATKTQDDAATNQKNNGKPQ